MNVRIFTVLFCFILLLPAQSSAETGGQSAPSNEMLEMLTNQIFLHADAKQTDSANHLTEAFKKVWTDMKPAFPESERRVVDTATNQLELMLHTGGSSEQIRNAAGTLRLCVDALVTDGEPLWKTLHLKLTDPVDDMADAVESGDEIRYHESLNRFLDQYARIYPSLMIDTNPAKVRRIDQLVVHLSARRLNDGESLQKISELNRLNQELGTVFDRFPDSDEDRLLPLALILGAPLLSVLIFVSWTKYREDRRRLENSSH